MKEIIITVIGASAGILLAIAGLYDIYKKHKVKLEVKKKETDEIKQQNQSIEGIRIRGEVRRTIEGLIDEFQFNVVQVIRVHNGGKAMKPVNSTLKATIEFELLRKDKDDNYPFGLKELKLEWQSRDIDTYFERFLEDLLLDKVYYLNDIELLAEHKGLRQIYNKMIGQELFFIELGFVGYDYLFVAIQRHAKEPIENNLLSNRKKILIDYKMRSQTNNIFKMIKSAM